MSQLLRLVEIMARLRTDCPWDAEQTHRSLVKHLIEETAEVVDAIEAGGSDGKIPDDDLREELGDLLLQIYFPAEIASTQDRFGIEDVAGGICDKLVRRHPWVFDGADDPADMMGAWEAAKRAEKRRRSALEGIAESLPTLARADKVVSRTQLTEHIYDQDFDRDSNMIEVFVGRLRKKLGVDVIETVRGLGYRLSEPSKGEPTKDAKPG